MKIAINASSKSKTKPQPHKEIIIMEIVLPNTSFGNSCILHDTLGLSGAQIEHVESGALNEHIKTDEFGNITHILGKKVIRPEDAEWYELEGVSYDDRKESQIAVGLLDPQGNRFENFNA